MEISELVHDTIRTWSKERPGPDFTAMSTALKLNLLVNRTRQSINDRMLELGVTVGEFDVLATLRRHGKSGVLMPTEIAGFAMISPSGLTNRLTRLEKMGHIERLSDPDDRRISLARLTAKGRKVADVGIRFTTTQSTEMMDRVKSRDLAVFNKVLDQMMRAVEE